MQPIIDFNQILLVLTLCLNDGRVCNDYVVDSFDDAGDCYEAKLELQSGIADDKIYRLECTMLDTDTQLDPNNLEILP